MFRARHGLVASTKKRVILSFTAAVFVAPLLTAFDLAPGAATQGQTITNTPLLEYAVRVAKAYENDPSYLLGEIAVRYARLGQFDKALELANSIDNEAARDVAKATIATTLKRAGDAARAGEVLDSIPLIIESEGTKVPRYKPYMLGEIAKEFAACGSFDHVFELALVSHDGYLIQRSLDAVLDSFVLNEHQRTDLSTLQKVIRFSARLKDGEDRRMLRKVAQKYAEAGEYGEAVRMANSLAEEGEDAHEFERDQAIHDIALLLAERGKFTHAIELAESASDYDKVEALLQIAKQLIAMAQHAEGQKLLDKVTAPHLKESYEEDDFDDAGGGARRLAKAAIGYASAGNRDKAQELLAVALKRARRVRKVIERDQALSVVAVSYAEVGMFEEAADAAQPNNFMYFKIKPSADVAIVALRQQRHREVQQLVKTIQDASVEQRPESKADGLVEIAREYIALGDNKSAIEVLLTAFEIAVEAPINDFQPTTMRNVAFTLAGAGDYTKAIEVAAAIKSTFHQALALADIGELQVRAGWVPDQRVIALLDGLVK